MVVILGLGQGPVACIVDGRWDLRLELAAPGRPRYARDLCRSRLALAFWRVKKVKVM